MFRRSIIPLFQHSIIPSFLRSHYSILPDSLLPFSLSSVPNIPLFQYSLLSYLTPGVSNPTTEKPIALAPAAIIRSAVATISA